TTPGFQISDAFTGTLTYNTGPRTYWANLSALAPANASFGAKIQAAETYFHTKLISRLSSVDRLAIVQDPPADVLVTDPSGRQTGLTPSGAIVNDIPGSQYYHSDEGSAAIILEPSDGFYQARAVGTAGDPFSLGMAVVDIAGPDPATETPFIS